jgi:hypothetical protein
MICIHHNAANDKKVFSQIGLSFALIYATIITIDYFVRLAVIEPSIVSGETAGLSLFAQYNPHGIFIGLEGLGYLMMSVAFLFTALFLPGEDLSVQYDGFSSQVLSWRSDLLLVSLSWAMTLSHLK